MGATKPEEYGYYFWWGDTVGYKRNASKNGWVSVANGASFSFFSICPIDNTDKATLQSLGYIDWKAEPWKTVAKPFAKAPQLVLPVAGGQPGEIALKFAASGAVTAAGRFVLGTDAKGKEIVHSASCAAVVVPETEPNAGGAFKAVVHLYFAPNEKKGFAGHVRLVKLRWTGTAFEVE